MTAGTGSSNSSGMRFDAVPKGSAEISHRLIPATGLKRIGPTLPSGRKADNVRSSADSKADILLDKMTAYIVLAASNVRLKHRAGVVKARETKPPKPFLSPAAIWLSSFVFIRRAHNGGVRVNERNVEIPVEIEMVRANCW